MGSVPVLQPRDVERLLERYGFTLARERGSRCHHRHPDGRSTTVPFHGSRDTGLSVEELLAKR